MARNLKVTLDNLYHARKVTRWDSGVGACLPEAYKKFWHEWKIQKPAPVHWIKEEGLFKRNEFTGEVHPVQNFPLPLKYPKEIHDGIWGGEAVVQGFVKKNRYRRRIPKFWVPNIKRSIVHSEVLDTYIRTIITHRTILMIHENYGFDHYLLKTPACDLRSELALTIKRNILIALADKTLYPNDPEKREEIYDKYKQYLEAYTREEIEWYGLNYPTACKKYIKEQAIAKQIVPLKLTYRSELIAQLQEAKIEEAMNVEMSDPTSKSTWISKINPFAKSPKAE